MKEYYSRETGFFNGYDPGRLLEEFGSPLYVYNEKILRTRCREMVSLVPYEGFKVTYSVKANSNLALLKIIRGEGLHADAMSPGEIYVLQKAGFRPEEIFYISNNVSTEEMLFAVEKGIMVSVDSLSQLETFGRNFSHTEVSVRLNPGVGAGFHSKVVTAGNKTKFGIQPDRIGEIHSIAKRYKLRIAGLNQHIGSLFMEGERYLQSVRELLRHAMEFPDLDFLDFGGGFGIPYNKQDGQKRLNLETFGQSFGELLENFSREYGSRPLFRIEPGRYIVAECGILLGQVHALKENGDRTFAGTDLGFNVLIRPAMYGSHHDIEVYRAGKILDETPSKKVTIVGNICETGDILAEDRELPVLQEGDILGVMDAGAYGYSMSSNYNNRLRPAEILLDKGQGVRLIRSRDTLEELVRKFV